MQKQEIFELYNEEIQRGCTRGEAIERILPKVGQNWRLIKDAIPDYEEDDPRRGCQSDDYGVVIDPISLEEIPDDKLIHFEQNGKRWCFNVETLAKYVREGKPENPVTRDLLPETVLSQIEDHNSHLKVQVVFAFPSVDCVFETYFYKGNQ
jgi:hypothetical protein